MNIIYAHQKILFDIKSTVTDPNDGLVRDMSDSFLELGTTYILLFQSQNS